jgi:hypothetical protein
MMNGEAFECYFKAIIEKKGLDEILLIKKQQLENFD